MDDLTRFMTHTHREHGHLIWTGTRTQQGYGKFKVYGRMFYAHRWHWIRVNGPVPDGLMVLHNNDCHTPACVELTHLRLGTHEENMQDYRDMNTTCSHGHPWNEENTGFYRGRRVCRACDREQHKALEERRRSDA